MPIVGDVLSDRYEIQSVLGAGGTASVYRAIDLRLQREVAVKVLQPNLAADRTVAARFDREARALAAAAHPAVVAVFDVEPGDPETGREPFYVMELCEGGSLADHLQAGRLDPAQLVPTIAAVAEGLAEIHRQGVIHRDVKPHNILFAGDRPKLADFGLARSEHPTELSALTADGTMLGTLPYLAPELLAGVPPTTASDVYALGATAFQGLTGRLPRPAGSMSEIVESRSVAPPSVSSVAPELGEAFDEPIAAALAVEPAARPTPTELAERLTTALDVWRSSRPSPVEATADGVAETVAVAVAAPPSRAPIDSAADTLEMLLPPEAPPTSDTPSRRPFQVPALRGWSLTDERRRWLAGAAVVVGVAALMVLLAVGGTSLDGSGLIETDPPPTATVEPSPTVKPSETVGPSPTVTAPTVDPAQVALDEVFAAINAARGGRDGLNGSDAHDLESLAAKVRSALQDSDYEAAREATDKLRERAEKLTENMGESRRERLRDAIAALEDAIPSD